MMAKRMRFQRPLLGAALALLAGPGAALRALPGDPAAVLGLDSDGQPVRVADFLARPSLDGVIFPPGADLADADFTGKTLQGARLDGTDCRRARFRGVDLRCTGLQGTRCKGADFAGAQLDPEDAKRLRAHGFDLEQAWVAARSPAASHAGGQDQRSWENHLALLKAYVDEHGHSRVPQKFKTAEGVQLGNWVNRQRAAWKNRKPCLALERIRTLEGLPGWTWNPKAFNSNWEDHLVLLKAYVAEHGTSRVPAQFLTECGVKLGHWVGNQRRLRGRKTHCRTPERTLALEALPGWTWDTRTPDTGWEEHHALLKGYVAEHGTSRVPLGFKTVDGIQLGVWVHRQHQAWNEKNPALTPERIRALEALPDWVWQSAPGNHPKQAWRESARAERTSPVDIELEEHDPPGAAPVRVEPAGSCLRRGGPRGGGPPVSDPWAAHPGLPVWPAVKLEPADPLPVPPVKSEPVAAEPAAPPDPDPDILLGALPGPSWLFLRDFAATRNLDGVSFVPGAPLRGADFQGRTLAQADLGEADCTGASFRDVDLRTTRLAQATLAGADFTGALLRPGDARDLQARGIDLGGARILEEPARGAKRKEADVSAGGRGSGTF